MRGCMRLLRVNAFWYMYTSCRLCSFLASPTICFLYLNHENELGQKSTSSFIIYNIIDFIYLHLIRVVVPITAKVGPNDPSKYKILEKKGVREYNTIWAPQRHEEFKFD